MGWRVQSVPLTPRVNLRLDDFFKDKIEAQNRRSAGSLLEFGFPTHFSFQEFEARLLTWSPVSRT